MTINPADKVVFEYNTWNLQGSIVAVDPSTPEVYEVKVTRGEGMVPEGEVIKIPLKDILYKIQFGT